MQAGLAGACQLGQSLISALLDEGVDLAPPRKDTSCRHNQRPACACNGVALCQARPSIPCPVTTCITRSCYDQIHLSVSAHPHLGLSNSMKQNAGGRGGTFRSMLRMRPYCNKAQHHSASEAGACQSHIANVLKPSKKPASSVAAHRRQLTQRKARSNGRHLRFCMPSNADQRPQAQGPPSCPGVVPGSSGCSSPRAASALKGCSLQTPTTHSLWIFLALPKQTPRAQTSPGPGHAQGWRERPGTAARPV